MNQSTPIAVDLDGSLIHTDILYETFVRAVFRHPWCLFMVIPWLLKSKAYLKMKLASLVDFDIQVLPYNQQLLDYLKEQNIGKLFFVPRPMKNWRKVLQDIWDYLMALSEVLTPQI